MSLSGNKIKVKHIAFAAMAVALAIATSMIKVIKLPMGGSVTLFSMLFIPTGTDLSVLTKKQAILSNAVGPLRLKSKYYFNGQMVGWGMQYERSIMTSLLTTPTL